MKYKVEITETLQKTIEVEAESEIEAHKIIRDYMRANNEEIILDYNDLVETQIDVLGENDETMDY